MRMILGELKDVVDREVAALTSLTSSLHIVRPRDQAAISASVKCSEMMHYSMHQLLATSLP